MDGNAKDQLQCKAVINNKGNEHHIIGNGTGAVNAFVDAINSHLDLKLSISNYVQHALSKGSDALAASYIELNTKTNKNYWGVGIDNDSIFSTSKAIISALNRCFEK